MSIVLFHRTTAENARAIIKDGFRDIPVASKEFTGVWLSNRPPDIGNRMPLGESLLKVTLAIPEYELAFYGAVDEENESYGEWLIPASLIKIRGNVEIVDEDKSLREMKRRHTSTRSTDAPDAA